MDDFSHQIVASLRKDQQKSRQEQVQDIDLSSRNAALKEVYKRKDKPQLQAEWQHFYAALLPAKKFRLKINVPETILMSKSGYPSDAYCTNCSSGVFVQRPSQHTTLKNVEERLLSTATDSERVCVARFSSGPRILTQGELHTLIRTLNTAMGSAASVKSEVPFSLQTYIAPKNDIRYVGAFLRTEYDYVCESFERRSSAHYRGSADPIHYEKEVVDESMEMKPVEGIIALLLRRTLVSIANYISRSHDLHVQGLVCEFIEDSTGRVYMTGLLGVRWAGAPATWAAENADDIDARFIRAMFANLPYGASPGNTTKAADFESINTSPIKTPRHFYEEWMLNTSDSILRGPIPSLAPFATSSQLSATAPARTVSIEVDIDKKNEGSLPALPVSPRKAATLPHPPEVPPRTPRSTGLATPRTASKTPKGHNISTQKKSGELRGDHVPTQASALTRVSKKPFVQDLSKKLAEARAVIMEQCQRAVDAELAAGLAQDALWKMREEVTMFEEQTNNDLRKATEAFERGQEELTREREKREAAERCVTELAEALRNEQDRASAAQERLNVERETTLRVIQEMQEKNESLRRDLDSTTQLLQETEQQLNKENEELRIRLKENDEVVSALRRQAVDYREQLSKMEQQQNEFEGEKKLWLREKDELIRAASVSGPKGGKIRIYIGDLVTEETNRKAEELLIQRELQEHKQELLMIYYYYATFGENTSVRMEKSPRMNALQFQKFLKDCKVVNNKTLHMGAISSIFASVNVEGRDGGKIDTGDRELEFHEFCEAIVRVSAVRKEEAHLVESLKKLILEFVLPNAKQRVDIGQFLDLAADKKKKKVKNRRGSMMSPDELEKGESRASSRTPTAGLTGSQRENRTAQKETRKEKKASISGSTEKSPSTEFDFKLMPAMPTVVREPSSFNDDVLSARGVGVAAAQ